VIFQGTIAPGQIMQFAHELVKASDEIDGGRERGDAALCDPAEIAILIRALEHYLQSIRLLRQAIPVGGHS